MVAGLPAEDIVNLLKTQEKKGTCARLLQKIWSDIIGERFLLCPVCTDGYDYGVVRPKDWEDPFETPTYVEVLQAIEMDDFKEVIEECIQELE